MPKACSQADSGCSRDTRGTDRRRALRDVERGAPARIFIDPVLILRGSNR
jgi:hypothetical protein